MRLAILALVLAAAPAPGQPPAPAPGRFPVADNDAAWANLPRDNPPLPPWARVLVGPLPRTTAKLLELDYLHRAGSPLGAELSAVLRWTAANALASPFGRGTAEADLRRAGVPARAVTALGDIDALAPDVRVAVRFARKLTLAGHAITDAEFAELLKAYGPEKTTAIVHTVAYANFHNRLVLGLGADGDATPPIDAKFSPEALAKVPTPARPPWDDLKAAKGDGLAVRVAWSAKEFDELNATLDRQKERKLRIPLPDDRAFAKLSPRERDGAKKIAWNTVSVGYQPELTRAWFAPLYAFYEEAKVDRVFTNAVFWVVTRTNDCFY